MNIYDWVEHVTPDAGLFDLTLRSENTIRITQAYQSRPTYLVSDDVLIVTISGVQYAQDTIDRAMVMDLIGFFAVTDDLGYTHACGIVIGEADEEVKANLRPGQNRITNLHIGEKN
jgi:hypothetical protein